MTGSNLRNNNNESDFRRYITTLIEIFYGLAIASGVEITASTLFNEKMVSYTFVCLSIASFVVAVGDWICYHLLIDPYPYKNIGRIVLDIILITSIFFLFRSAGKVECYIVIMWLYFVLNISYSYLLKREGWNPPPLFMFFLWTALSLIFVTYIVVSGYFCNSVGISIETGVVTFFGTVFGAMNFYNANTEIKKLRSLK